MKKIIAIILCLAVCFGFCGCKNQNKKTAETAVSSEPYAVNIMAQATKGKIPEIDFSLGTSIARLKEKFASTLEPGSEIQGLTETIGEKTVWLDGGSVLFCYEKAKLDEGIAVIVAKDYAYNFAMGGIHAEDDVIAAMGEAVYEKSAITEDDVFFLPALPENGTKLTYTCGDNILKFIFVDGTLSSVVLYNPANWTV